MAGRVARVPKQSSGGGDRVQPDVSGLTGASLNRGFCRFCRGEREVNSARQCVGCGMPAGNAMSPTAKVRKARPMCPRCSSSHSTETERGRFSCETCGGTFEPLEQTFVDDRPEQNAMKRERQKEFSR